MLILECPYCGVQAEETELHPCGEAHLKRFGSGTDDDDAFEAYVFIRESPKGVHFERWVHANGCGKCFCAAGCTVTLDVFGSHPVQATEPPKAVRDRVGAKRPGRRWRVHLMFLLSENTPFPDRFHLHRVEA